MRTLLCALLLLQSCINTLAQTPKNDASQRDPARLLARAKAAMGFSRVAGRVLHYHAGAAVEHNYESDRMYPPFLMFIGPQEIWFDPASGVLRVQSQAVYPGGAQPASIQIDDGANIALQRGEQMLPVSRRQSTARYLSAWAVIDDWSKAGDVTVSGREKYRDYERIVLSRPTPEGEQRLYLDPKSGFPVKLDMIEPHYLWGQWHVEYIWATWFETSGIVLPGAVARVADGDVEISQTIGEVNLLPRDAAPSLSPPPRPATPPAELSTFLQPIPPTATAPAPNLLLLTNPGYGELVAFASGEIYLFDSTQGEARAREDAAAIAQAFPGRHHINLVVSDTAWPHVAGVRYWVSQGATVISHPGNREFLERVVERKWTLKPDALEQLRSKNPAAARMKFVGVAGLTRLAGGAVQLVPIDGIGSELALMAYLPAARFLWGSDYIQTLSEPSLYAAEVIRAAERAGFAPERAAAEHLPVTQWSAVKAAQEAKSPSPN